MTWCERCGCSLDIAGPIQPDGRCKWADLCEPRFEPVVIGGWRAESIGRELAEVWLAGKLGCDGTSVYWFEDIARLIDPAPFT